MRKNETSQKRTEPCLFIHQTIRIFFAILISLMIFSGCAPTSKEADTLKSELSVLTAKLKSQDETLTKLNRDINIVLREVYPSVNRQSLFLTDRIYKGKTFYTYDAKRNVTIISPTKINVRIEIPGTIPDYVVINETSSGVDFYFRSATITEIIYGLRVYSSESLHPGSNVVDTYDLGRHMTITQTRSIATDLNEEQTKLANEFSDRKYTLIINRN